MRLDLLAEIDGKYKVNLEIQNRKQYNIIDRGKNYASYIRKEIKTEEEQWLAYISH